MRRLLRIFCWLGWHRRVVVAHSTPPHPEPWYTYTCAACGDAKPCPCATCRLCFRLFNDATPLHDGSK